MQKEIKNISSALDELSKDIMDFEKKDEKPSEDVFEKIKVDARRNPILEHPLSTKDDVIKTHYMTLLVSAIYSTNKKTLDAWLLAQRIACGISLSQELSDISLDALSLTEKQIDEFTYSIIENNLEEIFSFDLLLLFAVCGGSDSKMLEYIVDLIALVNCSRKKLGELSTLAKIVASQDSNKYLDFCVAENEIDLYHFFCYIKLFHDGLLVCNKKSFYIWHREQKTISNEIFSKLPKEIISCFASVENTVFKDIEKDSQFLLFRGNKKIQIKNCKFRNVSKCLEIYEASKLVIDKSEFNNMKNRALYITKTNKISIADTKFVECKFRTDSKYEYGYQEKAYGGAMYLASINELVISTTTFESCYAQQGEGGTASGSAAYMYNIEKGNLIACKFKNCHSQYWRYSSWSENGYLIEYDDSYNVEAKDCTYKDCGHIWKDEGFTREW